MNHRPWIAAASVWLLVTSMPPTSAAGCFDGGLLIEERLIGVASHASSLGGDSPVLLWLDQRHPSDPVKLCTSVIQREGLVPAADAGLVTDRPHRWNTYGAVASASELTAREALTAVAYVVYGWPGPTQVRARMLRDRMTVWDVAATDPPQLGVEPCVAGDGSGGAWVGWIERSGDRRVCVQHLLADGSRALGDDGLRFGSGDKTELRSAADGHGGVFLSWTDESVPEAGSRWLQHVTAAGDLAPGWSPAGRTAVEPPFPSPSRSMLLQDPLGGVYLVWQGRYVHGREDALALRFLADGSRAPGWPAGGLLVAAGSETSTELEDATEDGAGGVLLSVRVRDERSRTHVCRIGPDGRRPPGWPAWGLAASTSRSGQEFSRVIGQHGGALVVWSDYDEDEDGPSIRGARFLADGSRAPGWPATGLVVCDGPGYPMAPMLARGHDDGAIVVWLEEPSDVEIHAQWVDAHGRLGMPAGEDGGRLELAVSGPNPARGVSRFTLELPAASLVVADVMDVGGRLLARLENRVLPAGRHELTWDADGTPPGIRFLRIRTSAGERTLRFVALR